MATRAGTGQHWVPPNPPAKVSSSSYRPLLAPGFQSTGPTHKPSGTRLTPPALEEEAQIHPVVPAPWVPGACGGGWTAVW